MNPLVLFYASGRVSDYGLYRHALRRQGYSLRHCPDTVSLRLRVRQACGKSAPAGGPVLAVLAADTPRNRSAAGILSAFPQVGVLAQVDDCDDASLTETLQLGIDAWCPRDCAPEVLALALHALKRRLEHYGAINESTGPPAAGATGVVMSGQAVRHGWVLREQGWVLVSPEGTEIPLTSVERRVMITLAQQPDNAAAHHDLLAAIGRSTQERPDAKMGIGVIFSRLRRKVSEHGAELPIQSLHKWGYMFSADLNLHPAPINPLE